MRGWKIKALLILTSALLSLAAVGILLAATDSGATSGAFGNITEITVLGPDEATITLNTNQGLQQISITPDTSLVIPGNNEPSTDDLAVGQVLAVSVKSTAGKLVAVKALVKPEDPTVHRHLVGVVTDKEDNQISLVSPQGESITIDLPLGLGGIEIGEALTTILKSDPATNGLTLSDVRTAQQAIDRLKEEAQNAQADWILNNLKNAISTATEQHLSVLYEVAQQVAPEAQAVLNQVLSSQQQRYQEDLSDLDLAPPAISISGVIVLRDSFRKTITVLPDIGRPAQITVTDDSEIIIEGKLSTFSDLELGQRIRAKYDSSTFEIRTIEVTVTELEDERLKKILEGTSQGETEGRITQIDSASTPPIVTITLTTGDLLALSLPPDAKIIVSDREVDLDILPFNARVKVRYNPDTLEALSITADAGMQGESFVSGAISGLRKKSGVVTITTVDGTTITARIAEDAPIWRNENRVTIAEARIGDVVRPTTRYNASTQEILSLSLRSPSLVNLEGVIVGKTSSDGDKYLTISTPALEMVRLRIPTIAIIQRNGQRVSFEDVNVGDRVRSGAYDPSTMEAASLDMESALVLKTRGTITSVDTMARTFTIQPFEGGPMTLRFTFDTEAEKNGASDVFFNALMAGDIVASASYRSDNDEVLKMIVLSVDVLTTRGYIKDIDPIAKRIVVATIDQEIVLLVNDDTQIIKDGKSVPLTRLSQRDIVAEAYYMPNGSAIRIETRSPNTVTTVVRGVAQGQ